jgi:hypothetical protein
VVARERLPGGARGPGRRARLRLRLERACFLTVLHRLMVAGSDRAADARREDYRIDGAEELALHHLYRTMAWLGEELPGSAPAGRTPFAPRGRRRRSRHDQRRDDPGLAGAGPGISSLLDRSSTVGVRNRGILGVGAPSPTSRRAVFCSFLALVLRKELQDRLAGAGLRPEWAEVVRDLDRLQEVEVEQDGKRFALRTPTTGCAGKLFQTLGVALPPNIRDAAPQAATLADTSQL